MGISLPAASRKPLYLEMTRETITGDARIATAVSARRLTSGTGAPSAHRLERFLGIRVLGSSIWRNGVRMKPVYVPVQLRERFPDALRIAPQNTVRLSLPMFSVPVK